MDLMQSRAKDILPNVLLTLLSIIQALALELLWTQMHSADYLLVVSWQNVPYWMQVAATFFGILVIWVVYATNVMRFRWVPGISDSVLPFFIGIAQFMLIEMLGPGRVGWWFLFLAVVFSLMHFVAHMTMRRARLSGDNDDFFRHVDPATWRDFAPPALMVASVAAMGLYLLIWPGSLLLTSGAMLAVLGILGWHLHGVTYFWHRTMNGIEAQRDGGGQRDSRAL